jgi:signal transduction histidine kinase
MRNRLSKTHHHGEMKQIKRLQEWWGTFAGVRSRILVWYFLLTAGITFVSVYATYKIFCDSTQWELSGQLQRDVASFQTFLEQKSPPIANPAALTEALETFVAKQVPNPNRHLLLMVNGQTLYLPQPERSYFVQQQTDTIQRWANSTQQLTSSVDGYFIRASQPLFLNGQQQGVIIAVHDATMRYQMAELTLRIVVNVTLVGLVLFSAIAWLTAGRVLAPLRQVTDTARSISETDLTQRLSVQGKDEIAELTLTFNQMLDRLQAAFTSQQDFIKDVSHELRTPITIIQGHLELLNDDPQERRETVALVKDELRRMNRFVNDLLLLMRSERPNFLKLNPVDLDTFTEELFAKVRGLATRDWQLEAKGRGELTCDRQRITQVVMNLAQNATQYTQERDAIVLGSAVSNGTVQFWVRDSGEGIAAEDQKRIFDRFARGSNSERRSEGSGLGLSIVQALINAHGGHLELYSRLGQGSTFTIVLPQQQPGNATMVDSRNQAHQGFFEHGAVRIQPSAHPEGAS